MVQNTPLKGRTIAITRPIEQTQEAGQLIKTKGGIPYYIPAIEIKPLNNPEPLKKFITELQEKTIDYVALMSTNGVKHLLNATEKIKQTPQLYEGLKHTHVIAVGPKTAEALTENNIRVDMIPQKYSGDGLIEALANTNLKNKTFRIPRTSNASPTLTETLKQMGANVNEIYVYESGLPIDETLKTKFYQDLTKGHINAILFGSGLSAKNIFKMLTEKAPMQQLQKILTEKVTIVAIGPTTAQALKELNITVNVVPNDYLFDSALDALAQYWATP